MECNKEEATWARENAVMKMQKKDFTGARKIALRAQQIFPDLEHSTQILTVCDVHCAAENKLVGNEMDWYGILQIEQGTDETMIKKQYRKLALLLHPDKNKFAGAEAAFKLIGEAQKLLLDHGRRALHDMRQKASGRPTVPTRVPQSTDNNPYVTKQPGEQDNLRSKYPTSQQNGTSTQNQQPQPDPPVISDTFWTACPFCSTKYCYYMPALNKSLVCRGCVKPFIARNMHAENLSSETNGNQTAFPHQTEVSNQQGTSRDGHQSTSTKPAFSVKFQGNSSGENQTTNSVLKTECTSDVDTKVDKNGCSKRVNVKRKRKVENTSESYLAAEEDGDLETDKKVGFWGEQYPRKATSQKQQVSYNENPSFTDENVSQTKKSKGSGDAKKDTSKMNMQAGSAADVKLRKNEVHQKGASSGCSSLKANKETGKVHKKKTKTKDDYKRNSETNYHSVSSSCPKTAKGEYCTEYPDPEFNEFEKERKEECFKVGQLWAVYDPTDAMARFYVLIREVVFNAFKLHITWLKPDPDDKDEIRWANEDLPVSCGKFKLGQSENIDDRLIFSHVVRQRGSDGISFKIYPRKGEIWALFKNWNIDWHLPRKGKRKYEFEYVEVLLDYFGDVGICVAYLEKVEGFASLFRPIVKEGMISFQIPPSQLYRFSHMVPSFQLTGEEKGVPSGSFELDPASSPQDLEVDIFPNELKPGAAGFHSNGSSSKSPDSTFDKIDVLEPEFHNFDALKSKEKFQVGQVWALYSTEDAMPKYYGLIKKIIDHPDFELVVTWLKNCSSPDEMIHWLDRGMLICCGKFRLSRGRTDTYSPAAFSHQLKAEIIGKKNEIVIFPRKGEVWAMYKNWNINMKSCDLEDCEYDIVEVLEENASLLKVLVLQRVAGYNSVFKGQMNESSLVKLKVPRMELLRFSHQIPAFRLTQERGGSLRGFWELDPASVPVLIYCS